MARSLTLQLSPKKDCVEIIDGILTVRFQDGRRGIPFKDTDGVVTPEYSILLHRLNKPDVDSNGYIHDIFWDSSDETVRQPFTKDNGKYCLVLIRNVLDYKVDRIHGNIIRDVHIDEGKRDVLLVSSPGVKFRLSYFHDREVRMKLPC